MATSYTETAHPAEVILSEANGNRSRETVTLLSGQVAKAGDVLGIITATANNGKYKVVTVAATDGSDDGVAVALYAADATDGDVSVVVLARDCEVNKNNLTYGADVNTSPEIAAVHASLATKGIIAR